MSRQTQQIRRERSFEARRAERENQKRGGSREQLRAEAEKFFKPRPAAPNPFHENQRES
jgi:hypothetical protein